VEKLRKTTKTLRIAGSRTEILTGTSRIQSGSVNHSTMGFGTCVPEKGVNKELTFQKISVADYKHRGPGFDSRALLRIFLRELGLERGPLSLVIG
jgi:hypothetical protein